MLKKKRNNRLLIVSLAVLLLIIAAVFLLMNNNKAEQTSTVADEQSVNSDENNDATNEEKAINDNISTVSLAAVGDIMFHDDQLDSAHIDENTHDFSRMFEDVKPLLSDYDVTLANFETTMAGDSLPFTGYPVFNTPDEAADAIKEAGVDILTTANNHSLDTKDSGLKRTVDVLQEKGFKTVGTYSEKPESRVLVHEVNDIQFAILSYTESTNGLGDQYPADELNSMINLMTKENIERDVKEAKELGVDFIITFMHWGEEYMTEPNETQIDYANFMAEQGVDLILGSHPHVIQPTDTITSQDQETFVVYSMGNFVSNQRVETLGEEFARTEDGVIVQFNIEKDHQSNETTIKDVEFIPTWVYKIINPDTNKPEYRILPIDDTLNNEDISEAFKVRMEDSYDATMSQLSFD